MLTITDLTKGFKNKRVFSDMSLTLENGIYGFLGPNGAGKTTLIRCIGGVYRIKEGKIECDGNPVGDKRYIDNLGYLPQSFGLFRDMTLEAALDYMAGLKGIKGKKAVEEIERVLKIVNLSDRKEDKIKSLSGGMLRRLGIAQALLGDPKLLIFDEPTAGLDPEERIRFKKIIAGLSKDRVILISTHICSDIEALCDNVIVIDHGYIKFNGDLEELEEIGRKSTVASTTESNLERGYLCLLSKEQED
jgi:ABC-2 type transport system ATP-binding protein